MATVSLSNSRTFKRMRGKHQAFVVSSAKQSVSVHRTCCQVHLQLRCPKPRCLALLKRPATYLKLEHCMAVCLSAQLAVVQFSTKGCTCLAHAPPELILIAKCNHLYERVCSQYYDCLCRGAGNPEDAAIPWDAFPIGGVTAGAVHAHEEFGVTVDLLADENIVGLISPGQVDWKLQCRTHNFAA